MTRQHMMAGLAGAALALGVVFGTQRLRQKQACEDAFAARDRGDLVGMLRAIGYTEADIFDGDEGFIFKLAEIKARRR